MLTVPAPTIVTVVPDTVATVGSELANDTASPDEADAVRLKGGCPTAFCGSSAKLIVWPARATALPVAAVMMLTLTAPGLESTTARESYEPAAAAVAASLIQSVPDAEPPAGANVAVAPYVLPSLDTSKPVGAAAVRLPTRLLPDTANDWAADAVP